MMETIKEQNLPLYNLLIKVPSILRNMILKYWEHHSYFYFRDNDEYFKNNVIFTKISNYQNLIDVINRGASFKYLYNKKFLITDLNSEEEKVRFYAALIPRIREGNFMFIVNCPITKEYYRFQASAYFDNFEFINNKVKDLLGLVNWEDCISMEIQ